MHVSTIWRGALCLALGAGVDASRAAGAPAVTRVAEEAVVDWKTGEPPADDEARRHAAVQLALYRLAWAGLTGRPESEVRAAFHYVRSGRTVTPDVLLGAEELQALLSPEGPEEERCA